MAKMAQAQEWAQNVDLNAILARLEASEAKTRELEAKLNPVNKLEKSKEIYKWPWNYSYKLWGDVPVLSYKSVKWDITKDFTYKNHLGVLVNNQFLMLKLADGKEVNVDAIEFGMNFTRSEKLPAEIVQNGNESTGYKFQDSTYGEFIVSSNFIN